MCVCARAPFRFLGGLGEEEGGRRRGSKNGKRRFEFERMDGWMSIYGKEGERQVLCGM